MTQATTAAFTFAHYVDLMDDEALARYRQSVMTNPGHDMAAVNHNSLRRLIARIDVAEARLAVAHFERDEARRTKPTDDLSEVRGWVAKLYCAAGCSCCRDDENWDKASDRLGEMLSVPRHHDDSGVDWYAARDAAREAE